MLRNCNRSIAGRRILGTPNVGILAATIVAETASGDNGPGLLYDEALANAGKQLRAKITSYTGTPGKLFVFENGSFLIQGEADGAYSIGYDVLADNVIIKSDTASVTVGSIHASVLGANLTGTSALQPGSATGQHNASVPGASLQGSSTLQPGVAAGGQSGDASAPGASLSSSGTLQPGSATGQQNATAPGTSLQGVSSLQAGQAIGDRDATAPGVDLSGPGTLVGGGAANSQLTTHPRYIIKARARRYVITHR